MACGSKVCSMSMRSVTWALVLGGSLALLIWAKLRLVTAIPRTAYAQPEQVDSAKPAAEGAGTAAPGASGSEAGGH